MKYSIRLNEDRLPYLVKEAAVPKERVKTQEPGEVFRFLSENEDIENLPEEHVFLMCFDSKMIVNGYFEVSIGSATGSIVDPKAVYTRALALGAKGIILIHNHPSGDPSYSSEDMEVCQRLISCGKLLSIPLMDFIIAGKGKFLSFKLQGLMKG